MILVPALAVVQIWKVRLDEETKVAASLKVREEMNLQCQQFSDTCQLFTSIDDSPISCDKILEHGGFCLYKSLRLLLTVGTVF